MGYAAGRLWIETLRIDEANTIFGVRVNVFTAALALLLAATYFLAVRGPRASVVAVRTDGEQATLRYEVVGNVRAPSATRMTADEPKAEALDE